MVETNAAAISANPLFPQQRGDRLTSVNGAVRLAHVPRAVQVGRERREERVDLAPCKGGERRGAVLGAGGGVAQSAGCRSSHVDLQLSHLHLYL